MPQRRQKFISLMSYRKCSLHAARDCRGDPSLNQKADTLGAGTSWTRDLRRNLGMASLNNSSGLWDHISGL